MLIALGLRRFRFRSSLLVAQPPPPTATTATTTTTNTSKRSVEQHYHPKPIQSKPAKFLFDWAAFFIAFYFSRNRLRFYAPGLVVCARDHSCMCAFLSESERETSVRGMVRSAHLNERNVPSLRKKRKKWIARKLGRYQTHKHSAKPEVPEPQWCVQKKV